MIILLYCTFTLSCTREYECMRAIILAKGLAWKLNQPGITRSQNLSFLLLQMNPRSTHVVFMKSRYIHGHLLDCRFHSERGHRTHSNIIPNGKASGSCVTYPEISLNKLPVISGKWAGLLSLELGLQSGSKTCFC